MTKRRLVLKALGLGGLFGFSWLSKEATTAEAGVGFLEGKQKVVPNNWKFSEYLSPQLVGWKGYFYIDGSVPNKRSIVAFKALDDSIVASPWALQIQDYNSIRSELASFKVKLRSLLQHVS